MSAARLLSGRYRFLEPLRSGKKSAIWLARDESDGEEVIVCPISTQRAQGLEPLVGWDHPHVAPIVALINDYDEAELPDELDRSDHPILAVGAHVGGKTLHQRLQAGAVDVSRAVQWVERLADALILMHATGGVHGAISPRAVVVSRVHLGVAPVLTYLAAPPVAAFCSPERIRGAGPSATDDVWALSALLYTVLAREVPFTGDTREALSDAIVSGEARRVDEVESELMQLVLQGLASRSEDRLTEASALGVSLRDWMFRHGVMQSADSESIAAKLVASATSAFPAPIHTPNGGSTPESSANPASTDTPSAVPEKAPEPADGRADTSDTESPGGEADEISVTSAAREADFEPHFPGHAEDLESAPSTVSTPLPSSTRVNSALSSVAPTSTSRAIEAQHGAKTSRLALFALALLVIALLVWIGTLKARAPADGGESRVMHSILPPSSLRASNEASASRPRASRRETTAITATHTGIRVLPKDPSVCMEQFVPEHTFGKEASVDFVCESRDLWRVARRLLYRVARQGSGEGMTLWGHLGRYELLAIAKLRATCCAPDAPAYRVPVPRTSCGTLEEPIEAVTRSASNENITKFELTASCLLQRGVHSPQSWHRVAPSLSRKYFDEFVANMNAKLDSLRESGGTASEPSDLRPAMKNAANQTSRGAAPGP